jgi:Helix-turn-helix
MRVMIPYGIMMYKRFCQMADSLAIYNGWMAKQDNEAESLRERIVLWRRFFMREYNIPSQRALARKLGVSQPSISKAFGGKTIGLDIFAKIHRAFHKSADVMLDSDPPGEK